MADTSGPADKDEVDGRSDEVFVLAPFNPTCEHAQSVALRLLALNKHDVVFDLGCGDGRFLRKAAQRVSGVRCVGIELEEKFVHRAKRALLQLEQEQEMSMYIDIRQGDALDVATLNPTENDESSQSTRLSLSRDATAVFLYLLPKGLRKVKPLLETAARSRTEESKPFRVASYMFSVPDWAPVQVDRTTKGDCAVYLYDTSSMKL